MAAQSSSTVEQRLARLEREVRRWRRLGAAALLGVLCFVLMGQFLPGVEVLESSYEVGGNGTCHGVFATGATTARLSLRDGPAPGQGAGQRRAELFYSSENGGNVSLRDANDVARASLRLPQNSGPRMTLRDAAGKSRLHAGVSGSTGRPGLYLNDSEEHALVQLTTDGDGGGNLTLCDSAQRPRLEIGVSPDGLPQIAFYDSHQRQRLVMGMFSGSESTYVALYDEQGRVAQRLPEADPTPLPRLDTRTIQIPSALENIDRMPNADEPIPGSRRQPLRQQAPPDAHPQDSRPLQRIPLRPR